MDYWKKYLHIHYGILWFSMKPEKYRGYLKPAMLKFSVLLKLLSTNKDLTSVVLFFLHDIQVNFLFSLRKQWSGWYERRCASQRWKTLFCYNFRLPKDGRGPEHDNQYIMHSGFYCDLFMNFIGLFSMQVCMLFWVLVDKCFVTWNTWSYRLWFYSPLS